MTPLKSPVVWFGGKSRVAAAIWERFGNPSNFVDPFFGSGAVLFARPHAPKTETVNDADALLCNFFRALQHDPEQVAYYADRPVNECDLHSVHLWLLLVKPDVERLLADPDAYDAKAAGRWVWGLSLWIGSGWCSGKGPWRIVDGKMVKAGSGDGVKWQRSHLTGDMGIERKRPHLMTDGKGINRTDLTGDARQVPYLSGEGQGINRKFPGVTRKLPYLSGDGMGVNRQLTGVSRQLPYISHGERGVHRKLPYVSHGSRGVASAVLQADGALLDYLTALAARLRRVRVCCGDWTRVVTPAVTTANGLTAVLLDPPYAGDERDPELYAHDSGTVAADVRAWAIAHGEDPLLRIAYCGYETEGETMPDGWTALRWKAVGGYGSQGEGRGRANAGRETVWFSRHCLKPRERPSLFDSLEEAS